MKKFYRWIIGLLVATAFAQVVIDVDPIVDVVIDNINGVLSEPNDPSSIAKAIDKILSDDKFRELIIQNGKKTAMEYSPKVVAEQHLDTYHSLFR